MELVTLHTHTNYCPHAFNSPTEMCAAAHALGITTVAITEHYPLTKEIDDREYVSMPKERIDEYVREIEACRALYPDLDILTGCELDWLGEFEDRGLQNSDLDPFEYILMSIHFIDKWPFDDPKYRGHWDEVGNDAIWNRYFEVWCEAAASDRRATAMSHPDLVKKYNRFPSFDPSKYYPLCAEAAKAGGRMIEVNTSGLDVPVHELYPHPALLREFCRAGIPCTVGTDAHDAASIGNYIMDGYKLMYDAGYRQVTVPMHGGGFRTIDLDDIR